MGNGISQYNEELLESTYIKIKELYGLIRKEKEITKKKQWNITITALCEKVPASIQHNGLLRTMQFLNAKEGDNAKEETEEDENQGINEGLIKHTYYNIMSQLLMVEYDRETDLLSYLLKPENMNVNQYKIITKKALEIAVWLKKHTYQFKEKCEKKY